MNLIITGMECGVQLENGNISTRDLTELSMWFRTCNIEQEDRKTELLQLQYFLAVAETEHMTIAANKMNVSQPVLSKSISNLEEELGVSLFERVGRRIRLSSSGKIFQKNVRNAMEILDSSVREVQGLEQGGFYEINIQIEAIVALAAELICEFSIQHPNVVFKIEQNETRRVCDKEKDTDILITSTRWEGAWPNSITLFSEEIVLAVAESHHLSQYNLVKLSQLEKERFVERRQGNNFRKITDSFFREAGVSRNVTYECDSPQMMQQLIGSGMGIGFIGTKSVKMAGIKKIKIDDIRCERFVEMQWREYCNRNRGVCEFIDFSKEHFKSFV